MRVSLDLPAELCRRAEELLPYLQSDAAVRSGRQLYRRNDVLLMALGKGMAVLEKELREMGRAGSGLYAVPDPPGRSE